MKSQSNYKKRRRAALLLQGCLVFDVIFLLVFTWATTSPAAPINTRMIGYSICGILFAVSLIAECILLRNIRKNAPDVSYLDPVTGAFNRTYFDSRASELIRSKPAGSYCLMVFDIANFNEIGSVLGDEQANRLLSYVCRVFSERMEDQVLICRSGNDMFNILLKSVSQEVCVKNLQQIIGEINLYQKGQEQPHLCGQTPHYLDFRVGLAEITDPREALSHFKNAADSARKTAAQVNPHLSFSCFSDMPYREPGQRKILEERIQDAFLKKEFIIYLQPKYHLKSQKVTGAEALVRWADPLRGIIPPAEFIPVMEETGFIEIVDLYVFENTCRIIRSWMDQGIPPIRISVNLSRVHFRNPDFIKDFVAILDNYRVPASLLELEFTEAVVFEDTETINRVIREIHKAGMTCAMDNFSSEYSSLHLLKDVTLDTIKLDRAFFRDTSNPERAKIVASSMIALAKNLGSLVVAEGVENHSQMQFLATVPCDFVQGFVISKPISQKEFEARFLSPAELAGQASAESRNSESDTATL